MQEARQKRWTEQYYKFHHCPLVQFKREYLQLLNAGSTGISTALSREFVGSSRHTNHIESCVLQKYLQKQGFAQKDEDISDPYRGSGTRFSICISAMYTQRFPAVGKLSCRTCKAVATSGQCLNTVLLLFSMTRFSIFVSLLSLPSFAFS